MSVEKGKKRNEKNILIIMSFISAVCCADVWHDHWERAVEHCGDKNYEAAETEFNQAIASLEMDRDDTHPHVYVDRARLYLLQDRYIESLADLNKAIASRHLTDTDRMRGLVTRIFTCSNLQMDEQVLADYDAFKAMSSDFPKVEFSKEKVIIRNIPKSNCYKKLAKMFLVMSEICENESDITELESGIIIAKRKMVDCGCGCEGAKMEPQPKATQANNDQTTVENCKYWCDKCAVGGLAWCAKVFKSWRCQTGCILAVELIKDGCHWCCRDGNFYQKCVKPFKNIVSYMGQPCDPEWD